MIHLKSVSATEVRTIKSLPAGEHVPLFKQQVSVFRHKPPCRTRRVNIKGLSQS